MSESQDRDHSPSRRQFLRDSSVGLTAAGIGAAAQRPSGGKRPNIFMIFSDDVTTKDLGCYGNSAVRTPRIDQFAKEGMVCTNMFTSSPSCAPSRAVMYTGLYPFRNGAHHNHSDVKPGTKSIAHYMQSLGYRVVLFGKYHAKPLDSFPFEVYEDKTSPGASSAGSDFLNLLANPGEKPLCVFYVKYGTHYPWPSNRHKYDPAQVALQPYLVDTPETRKMRVNYYSDIEEMDHNLGLILDLLKKHNLEENTLTIYTADHGSGWPHERDMLYDAGLSVPFVARWPGKIKPGIRSDALMGYVDIVPTWIEIAGGDVSKVVKQCGGPDLDGQSFLPILLGSQKEHRTELYGAHTSNVASAYPMRTIRTRTHRYIYNIDSHFVFPTSWACEAPDPEFTTRTPIWKSWERKAKTDPFAASRVRAELYRLPEELFDVTNDPHQLQNLADSPEHRQILLDLRGKVKAWMKQQGDAGDSAYHNDRKGGKRFIDELYCRRKDIDVRMKVPRATYSDDTAHVELACNIWRAEIYYTLDGSTPTKASTRYTKPFLLKPPVTLKAKGFWAGSEFWQGGETPLKEIHYDGVDFRFHYEGHLKPTYR